VDIVHTDGEKFTVEYLQLFATTTTENAPLVHSNQDQDEVSQRDILLVKHDKTAKHAQFLRAWMLLAFVAVNFALFLAITVTYMSISPYDVSAYAWTATFLLHAYLAASLVTYIVAVSFPMYKMMDKKSMASKETYLAASVNRYKWLDLLLHVYMLVFVIGANWILYLYFVKTVDLPI